MDVLAIIPARAGSKRISDKNIRLLGKIPLIEYSIISAVGCGVIDHIIITSDIESLSRYERKYQGMLEYHRRPDVLCGDSIGDYDVINDALNGYGFSWDLICYLRPTTPFRADYHICEAIKLMRSMDFDNTVVSATGLRSVELMAESAFKSFTMPTPWLTPIMDDCVDKSDWPNQEVTQTFKPNGYIDIARPETLSKGQLWGNWCAGYITPRTIEIDTPDDWKYAQWHANRTIEAPMRYGRKEIA